MNLLKNFLTIALIATTGLFWSPANADYYTHQVIVLNGGMFSLDPADSAYASIGAYNPETAQYEQFDQIKAVSAAGLIVEDEIAYALTDSILISYNLNTFERIREGHGFYNVVSIASYQDYLVITKRNSEGESIGLYAKEDFSNVHYFEDVENNAAHIEVVENHAYVTIPGEFGDTTGALAVLNLETRTTDTIVDFGKSGEVIQRIFHKDGYLYMVAEGVWGAEKTHLIAYNIETTEWSDHAYEGNLSRGAGIIEDSLLLMIDNGIGIFNLATMEPETETLIEGSFAETQLDIFSRNLYLSQTDYSTYGRVYVYATNGNLVDSFEVDISPEAIAFDHRQIETALHSAEKVSGINVYPNPASNHINISLDVNQHISFVKIFDLQGRNILEKGVYTADKNSVRLEVGELSPGVYILRTGNNTRVHEQKLIVR